MPQDQPLCTSTPTRLLDQVLSIYSHPDKIIIRDKGAVEKVLERLIEDGPEALQVIADFDMTLTRYHQDGVKCQTCHGILDYSPLMPEGFKSVTTGLRDKYYPIEIDHKLTIEEKIPFMLEWYEQVHEKLINFGLEKSVIKNIMAESRALFRDNVKLTLNMLNENNVPLLIFSAGIGDLINEVLEKYEVTFPNIKVVSNFMKFNNKGVICGFTEPIIHMFNKNRNILSGESLSYFVDLAHRVNALLLGDSLGDVQMDTGLENPGAILKIGFLNDNIEERRESFGTNFDIVLMDDQSMDFVNILLMFILKLKHLVRTTNGHC